MKIKTKAVLLIFIRILIKISAKQKTNALIALVLLLCVMFFWLKEI